MSETLCTLRTKGGGQKYTETSLWTNPSPSSTSGFAGQNVSLSDSLNNYKYIALKYAFSYALLTEAYASTIIISVEDFKEMHVTDDVNRCYPCMGARTSSGSMYRRFFAYGTDTSVTIGSGYYITGATANNNACIPLEILGLNELAHKTVISMDLIGEISLPASTSTVTGTLTQNISDYKNLFITLTAYNGSSLPTTGTSMPPLQFVDTDYFASNNIVGYYTAGNAGAMSAYSVTMQKLSDTSIKFTRSNTSGNRTAYVYGIK